jgi:DnaJ family protein C protein 28
MSHSKSQRHLNRLEELPGKLHEYRHPVETSSHDERIHHEKQRQSLVEERIQEAIANGEFDNLPGAGKPLTFNLNPHLEPGQEWAFNLLKRNGLAPEWIERDKTIRCDLKTARKELQDAWEIFQANPNYEEYWHQAVARFAKSLRTINQQILDFNLVAPSLTVHRSQLRLEDELRQLQGVKAPPI